jgi:signal peptidase I
MNPPKLTAGRNRWLATLTGLVMPGLGQIYNGELMKGISYFVALMVLYILGFRWTVLLGDKLVIVGALCTVAAAIGLYVAAIVDAYRTAARTEISFQLAPYNRWYFYTAAWLLGWVLVAGVVFEYVRDNVAEAYVIPSGSMEPAILRGDRILADKTAYRRMAPMRGDIAIMIYPDDRSKKYIKRIEALPGEAVTMADGTAKEVPHGFVFVLGDNRQNSLDSRYFGFVPMTDLVGKARQVYFSSGSDGIRWNRIGLAVGGH